MLLMLAGCEEVDNAANPQPVGTEESGGISSATMPGHLIDAAGAEREESSAAIVSTVPSDGAPPDPGAAHAAIEHEAATAVPAAEAAESDDATSKAHAGDASATPDVPLRIDLGALYIGAAPVPQPALSPGFAAALDEVRERMRGRDFLAIREHLQSAAAGRRSEADSQAYERMLFVHALWTQGWAHAAAAVDMLGPGDRIDTWVGPALVQDTTDHEILLRIDGAPRKFSTQLSDMDVRLAAALIEHRARVTGLALDAQAAALWTFAPEAGQEGQDALEAAQEAVIEAVQRGAYVDHLIAELVIRRREQSRPR